MPFSAVIYRSWKKMQLEKYSEIVPLIEPYFEKDWKMLDIGIGKAWFEQFIAGRGWEFETVGVDSDPQMARPQRAGIEYYITNNFETDKKFDFVVCFDALHLLPEPTKIIEYAKTGGYILAAVPTRFEDRLNFLRPQHVLIEGRAGKRYEEDKFIFARRIK